MPTVRGNTAATNTNSPVSPASTQIGDMVLVMHFTRGGAGVPTHTIQGGFTEIRSHAHDDGNTDGRLSIAYIIATSAGALSYNAYTSNTGTDFAGIVVLQKDTFHTVLVGDVQTSQTSTSNAAPNPASIVTPSPNCLVLAIAAWHLGSSTTVTVTAPSGYTKEWDMAGANLAELSVCSKVVATATTEDPGAFGDDVAPNGTCTITVAFRQKNWSVTAAQGAFVLTGNSAQLIRSGIILTAGTAAFTLTGITAALLKNRVPLTAAFGSFAQTGQAASLLALRRIFPEMHAFTLNGFPAFFTPTVQFVESTQPFVITMEGGFQIVQPGEPVVMGPGVIATGAGIGVPPPAASVVFDEFAIHDAPLNTALLLDRNTLRIDAQTSFSWPGWYNQVTSALYRPQADFSLNSPAIAAGEVYDAVVQFPPDTVSPTDFPVLSLPPLDPALSFQAFVQPGGDQVLIRFRNNGAVPVPIIASGKLTVFPQKPN